MCAHTKTKIKKEQERKIALIKEQNAKRKKDKEK